MLQQKQTVYIGFDPREKVAYDVCRHSILSRAQAMPTRVVPVELDRGVVKEILTRPIERREDGTMWCPISQAPMSTEFAISRFVVPWMHWPRYDWCLFMDCDMVCLADIAELFALADPKKAVMVVKHRHESGDATKMDGQQQTYYQRKNWSSVILWNCGHEANQRLTVEMLNELPGRDLHRFCWLNDDEIGALPPEWNHLIGVEEPNIAAKILHWTLGGPWFPDWQDGPFDTTWRNERIAMLEPTITRSLHRSPA